jgi:hypothetical protein
MHAWLWLRTQVSSVRLQRPAGRRAEKISDEPAGRKTGKGFSFVPCCVYHHQTFGTNSMAIRLAILACAVASLTGPALSAEAGEPWHRGYGYWEATHEALYRLEHNIALLQADPAVDDGYKAPAMTHEGAEVKRLRAALPPAHWRWTSPCCYSRRPIYIR